MIGELVARPEDAVRQPLARLRTGDWVEQDPECNSRQEQQRVACAVVLLALHSVGRLAELVERLPQMVLDVLVGGNAGGDAWAPFHSLGNAPKPGAILLTATDISSADGLVPGSQQRVVRPLIVRSDNFSSKKPKKP